MYQNDNLRAFSHLPIIINIDARLFPLISQMLFVINSGIITKEVNLSNNYQSTGWVTVGVNLTPQETALIGSQNEAKIILFDQSGMKRTLNGVLRFRGDKMVYNVTPNVLKQTTSTTTITPSNTLTDDDGNALYFEEL
jgi:hypothetical protein